MGISLWLVPPTDDALKLKTIMKSHERPSSASSSSYPEFYPHITLASLPSSGTSMSDLRSAIPTNRGSIIVEFGSIIIGSHYFRSVYIGIKYTPALRALHEHIHTKLGVDPRTPAFPHLSLCYIDEEDAGNGERERFLLNLAHDTEGKTQGEGITLRYEDRGEDDGIDGFEASEIWIINCDGPVDQWCVLDKVSLT